jgi:hypothetical protein
MRLRAILVLLLACPLSAAAQGPSAEWRTLETPHFRVHYPASSEGWTRRAAARLEAIRERVIAEVGYAPPEVVEVVVSDPAADSNGEAFAILGWPRLTLWTSPPGPESELGHYSDWSDLLIIHEETHLVHLLRPSRNPLRQRLSRAVPVGPIPLAAPRWVLEGYATVVEGRLTGTGRPNSDLRAAILRRWAEAGRLPTYAHLASDPSSWHGMSMAYLLGSAYLEWLEERAGPGSLRKLWARMTARTPRGFDDAFRGVFGDNPADLYDRFRAELTWRALDAEHHTEIQEGVLWQDLSWNTGAPAVSPDGQQLVIELSSRHEPSRLVIWSTAPDTEAAKKRDEAIRKMLARDPQDVVPVLAKPLARKPLHTLESHDGIEATAPRWMADGQSVLCVRFEPDPHGFLHPDLFRWTPRSGRLDRLTQQADLRDPDPSPLAADPDWAVAVRKRDGASAVVRIDLKTGQETFLSGPSLEEVYDRPRIAPDGRRIAYARHVEGKVGAWQLVIQDLDSTAATALAPPPGGTVSAPAWSADGRTLYAVVGQGGFIDLWAFSVDDPSRQPVRLTRTLGAALAPAPAPDGKGIFFLSLENDGPDLRRLDLTPDPSPIAPPSAGRGAPPPGSLEEGAASSFPPLPAAGGAMGEGGQGGEVQPFTAAEIPPGRPYGFGRPELIPLLGGASSPSGSVLELGLRSGDAVGRWDLLALGALSSDGWPGGGAVNAIWRGGPVALGLHLFDARERPSEQSGHLPRLGRSLDLDTQGAELSAQWDRRWSASRLSLRASALREDLDPALGPGLRRDTGSLTGGWSAIRRQGGWTLSGVLGGHAEWGRTGDDSWNRRGGAARLSLDQQDTGLSLSWRRDTSGGTLHTFDLYQLGGAETSLLPRTATAGLIAMPGLPFGTLTGTEHESQRIDLRLGFLPAPLFYERQRLWLDGSPKGGWLTLAGLEWRYAIGPIPLLRVPALDVRLGIARVLEEPSALEVLDGDFRWWVVAVWRP